MMLLGDRPVAPLQRPARLSVRTRCPSTSGRRVPAPPSSSAVV
jgi:hypothetical protein